MAPVVMEIRNPSLSGLGNLHGELSGKCGAVATNAFRLNYTLFNCLVRWLASSTLISTKSSNLKFDLNKKFELNTKSVKR